GCHFKLGLPRIDPWIQEQQKARNVLETCAGSYWMLRLSFQQPQHPNPNLNPNLHGIDCSKIRRHLSR
ncbi:MAG: hypothetical protein ACLFS1_11590, partial [Opitutales bacterium]